MRNIDWKVLGIVVWNAFKFIGSISIMIVMIGLAVFYLPGWALLVLSLLFAFVWFIVIEYKTEMFRRGR